MDLIVRNVVVRNRPGSSLDIAIADGIVTGIGHDLAGSGDVEIEGEGGLAVPSFVDSHSHIDTAMMIYQSRPAVTGTLAESIARSHEAKRQSSVSDVIERGERALRAALANGTGAIRVHCELDFSWGTTGVQGVLELKDRFAGVVDLQVLVLPVENPMDDDLKALIREGMDLGADAIGGSPHLEFSQHDVVNYVDFVFEIAGEYDVDVDMHIDQNVDAASYTRSAEYVAVKTLREGYEGRVTINHFGALSAYSASHAARVIALMKRAGVNFVTCPMEELIISGMRPSRIKELLGAGVNCAYAHNDNANMFGPYGRMDMLEAGLFVIHMGEFTRMEDAETIMDMATTNPAKIMGLDGYDLEEGLAANFNVLDAPSAYEAFRTNADRRYVIRQGRIVAETRTERKIHVEPAQSELS